MFLIDNCLHFVEQQAKFQGKEAKNKIINHFYCLVMLEVQGVECGKITVKRKKNTHIKIANE